MSDKTEKTDTPTKATALASGNTVTLVVEDHKVRDGKVLVRRADSNAPDAYYLYPVPEDWNKAKTVDVPAGELGRLAQPVNRLSDLRTIVPTPTDWLIAAWKVGLTGQTLPNRAFEAACQQLVQRMMVRADKLKDLFGD